MGVDNQDSATAKNRQERTPKASSPEAAKSAEINWAVSAAHIPSEFLALHIGDETVSQSGLCFLRCLL